MIFHCPYCRHEYRTENYFSAMDMECVSCRRKFTVASPNPNGPTPNVEQLVITVHHDNETPDRGLLTPTNILAGIGLYSLFK